MPTYVFSDLGEARFGKRTDAQTLGAALEAFIGPDGFKPAAVVEAARPKRSYLHKFFTWENEEAAEKYRLVEARQLVAAVRIRLDEDDEDSETSRAFYSIRQRPRRAYHDVESIRNSGSLQMRLMEQADRELASIRHRFGTIRDICEIIDEARTKIAAAREARMEEHR